MHRAVSLIGVLGLLAVSAILGVPRLVGAQGQGLGQCPEGADTKVESDANVLGVTVDFSADMTDVTVTAPEGDDVSVWGFGGTSKLVFLGVVEAGTTATFTDPLTGPQGQAQQFSHVCLGLAPTTTTTAAPTTTMPPTTTTTAAPTTTTTTTTTVPPTTTTAAVGGAVETTTTTAPPTTTTTEAEVRGVTVERERERERGQPAPAQPAPAQPAEAEEAQPAFTG